MCTVFCFFLHGIDPHVHDSTTEADRVIAQEEQPHVEAAATEREESSRRRMQTPTPVIVCDIWACDSRRPASTLHVGHWIQYNTVLLFYIYVTFTRYCVLTQSKI